MQRRRRRLSADQASHTSLLRRVAWAGYGVAFGFVLVVTGLFWVVDSTASPAQAPAWRFTVLTVAATIGAVIAVRVVQHLATHYLEEPEAGRVAMAEAARLEGVLLAARTAQHEINNQLAGAHLSSQRLARDPALPPHLRELANVVVRRSEDAAATVRQLQQLTRLDETDWGPPFGTTIRIQDRAP